MGKKHLIGKPLQPMAMNNYLIYISMDGRSSNLYLGDQERGQFFLISVRHFGIEEDEKSYLIILRNITDQRKAQKQLEHLTHYDLLTNLPNRLQFESHFEHELARSQCHNRKFAVLFIDVNNFMADHRMYQQKKGSTTSSHS
ncbi:hypothetical protein A8135_02690 [Legionella jamestowniensis]|uniref:GGDEF domain-containing protein n=1 Tax=Legionella jamestowniensis TaxID=455 RepID=A0ABX2XT78_9GAMM|nr:GGDEF domain-containing protein [Legionella jamestowniensis]OCH97761.1 hypothetical protein A8135_02690 [Legionella jamestowniensis]